MPLQDNSKLVTDALLCKIANNNVKDVIENEIGATAFSFTNEGSGLTGDDTIRQFSSVDSILNYKSIYDGNKDNIIDLGSNDMLDIDRTSSKSAGADQITLEGLTGNKLRYLGEKQGYHVYADASVRLAGFTEGNVGNDSFNAGTAARTYFYDTALGLNLGGDTITGFGADDRIVTTTAIYNGTAGARSAITTGSNGVFDLSGATVNAAGDDGAANGGQIDLVGVGALYLQATSTVNGVTYYTYGTVRPAGNDAPTAAATTMVTVVEDGVSSMIAIGAQDADGDTLTYAVKTGEGPAKGSVVFDQAAGTFVYTPQANANGADAFTIIVSDGNGGTTEQRVAVSITPVNDAPIAAPTNVAMTLEDMASAPIAIGASDVDGDTLAYSVKADAGPAKGSVRFDQAAGTFVYTPQANANGSDAFTIVIADGNGGTTEQRVTVSIAAVQDMIAAVRLSDIAAGRGGFKILGEANNDIAGSSVSAAGDINKDGLVDILVGAPQNNSDGTTQNGAAYVVYGKADGATVDLDNVATGVGGFKILGESKNDYAGYAVSGAGDVNGDGRDDLLIGAFANSKGGASSSGAAYVVFGTAGSATIDLDLVATGVGGFKIAGESTSDVAGLSVSWAGDVNGDGLADIIVGAPNNNSDGASDNGAAYVVFGKAGGTAVDLAAVASGVGGFKILGESKNDYAGYAVSQAGDVNGDGLTDLIVGAPENDSDGATNNGGAYVVFGKTGGAAVDLDDVATGVGGFKILGEGSNGAAGTAVSAAGDVNGDGIADLFVGAPQDSSDGSTNNGAGYVVFGKAGLTTVDLDDVALGTGGFKILGEGNSDFAGYAVSSAGDVNGDGLADLLIGAYRAGVTGQPQQGAAYVVLGKTGGGIVDLDDVANGMGGFKIFGEAGQDNAGFSVSAAGDVNGDGLADLLVGAYQNDSDGSVQNGAAYVIFGSSDWLI